MRVLIFLFPILLSNPIVVWGGGFSLSDIVASTLQSNPRLSQKIYEIKLARASLDRSEWERFPSLSGGYDVSNHGENRSYLSLSQTIWDWGGRSNSIKASLAELNANEVELEDEIVGLVIDTGRIFHKILKLRLLVSASDDYLSELQDMKAKAQRRVDSDVGARVDLAYIDSRLSVTEIESLKFKSDLNFAYRELFELTGIDYRTHTFHVDSSFFKGSMWKYTELAYELSPERKRLYFELAIAEAELARVRANAYPKLTLNGKHYFSDTYTNEPSSEVLVSATFDFGPGLSHLSEIDNALFNLEALKESIKVHKREYLRVAEQEWLEVERLRKLLPPLKSSIESSTILTESYIRQFQTGRRTWLDLLNVQKELYQAKVDFLSANTELQEAEFRMFVKSDEAFLVKLQEEFNFER